MAKQGRKLWWKNKEESYDRNPRKKVTMESVAERKKKWTLSFGRSALVDCNLWRRLRTLSSTNMTSWHHSVHFSSLNVLYISSFPDISPSSLTKGSTLWGFEALALDTCKVPGEPAFPCLPFLWDAVEVPFCLLPLRTVFLSELLPPTVATSWCWVYKMVSIGKLHSCCPKTTKVGNLRPINNYNHQKKKTILQTKCVLLEHQERILLKNHNIT